MVLELSEHVQHEDQEYRVSNLTSVLTLIRASLTVAYFSSLGSTLPNNNIGLQPCYCFPWLKVRSQRRFKSCVLKHIYSVDLYGPEI